MKVVAVVGPEGVLSRETGDPDTIEEARSGELAVGIGIVDPSITPISPGTAVVVPPTTVFPGATPTKGTGEARIFPDGASKVVPPMTLLPPGTATV